MPADMFRPALPARRRRSLIPLSIAVHGVAVSAILIAPLLADSELPPVARAVPAYIEVKIPSLPPAPQPPRRASVAPPTSNLAAAPLVAPDHIVPDRGEPAPGLTEDGIPSGEGVGVIGTIVTGDPVGEFITPAKTPRTPVKVGGVVQAPRKIHDVPPRYPMLAQQARVQGTVTIAAVIGTDGRVKETQVLQSVALLDDAAVEAVRQWVFSPTRLNGEVVPVAMTVTVEFRLR